MVFNPCGHTIGEDDAEFWARTMLPASVDPTQGAMQERRCPFCGTVLTDLPSGLPYQRLFFQADDDGGIGPSGA